MTRLTERLLRIQMEFEAYDQHWPDCQCRFCDGLSELSLLRKELRDTIDHDQARRLVETADWGDGA